MGTLTQIDELPTLAGASKLSAFLLILVVHHFSTSFLAFYVYLGPPVVPF